ncbi:hypothetical protein GRS66_007382 [Saccharomyces pastorianus]|uniref:DEAD/DEAH-box helicase domain-containing protein n=1 Tax=Saccharomyces pastorianus TaxID=27292 RepID=A0A6C1E6A7_SACPS|nr:hypothetical protein GRS66_007382 [Saccharomyces pastorianus]
MQRIVARVTDRSGYGVDRSRAVQHSTSESELDYYRAKILCQKFQRLTSPATTPPIADLRRDDKKEIEKPIGDIYDLMEAGSCLFGNSQFPAFKSTDQSNFTATVLNGDRKLLALQAPTSFGKTVTYLLPMMVLAKTRPGKFIHFVSVPYVALKTATMKRVQQAGLVAADSSALGAIDFYTQVVTIDVIVGVFDGFAQDECVSNGTLCMADAGSWATLSLMSSTYLRWRKHFRPALRKFKSLSWSSFLKVIALSATMPKQLCMDICRERVQ